MKVLVDMNLSPRWVEFLRAAGYEALHWSSIGKATAPDQELLRFAAQHGYTVITHDLDFGSILAATHGNSPSVIQIRQQDVDPSVLASRVTSALNHLKTELEAGALVTIGADRTRVRTLPLH